MIKNFILSKIKEKCSVELNSINEVIFFFQILKQNNLNIKECHIQINDDNIFNEFLKYYCCLNDVYIYTNYNNIKAWKDKSQQYNFYFIYCIESFLLENKQNINNSDFTLLLLDPNNNLNIFINNPEWILYKDIIHKIYIEPNYLSTNWTIRKIEEYKTVLDTLFSAQLYHFAYNYSLFFNNFSIQNILNAKFYEKDNQIYINLINNKIGIDKICSNYDYLSGISIDDSGCINIINENVFLNMYFTNNKKNNQNFFGLNAISSGDWMIQNNFYNKLKQVREEIISYRFDQAERIYYESN